jgi:hypothetical protein
MLLAAEMLPKSAKLSVRPIAQHSQPMALLGRRDKISAPTVANAMNGMRPITVPNSVVADCVSSGTVNSTKVSTFTAMTSSHRLQASQGPRRGRMRSRLGDFTTPGGDGSPVVSSMVAPSDPHPGCKEHSPGPSRQRYEAHHTAKARFVR